jgi:Pyridoxamine 5'-phosphate oxidase
MFTMRTFSVTQGRAPQRSADASRSRPARCAAVSAQSQPACLSPQEAARTLVDIADRGTLATFTDDGWPLGTHAAYLLDKQGQPLLRTRVDAAATQHLLKQPRCSLYVQVRAGALRHCFPATSTVASRAHICSAHAHSPVFRSLRCLP